MLSQKVMDTGQVLVVQKTQANRVIEFKPNHLHLLVLLVGISLLAVQEVLLAVVQGLLLVAAALLEAAVAALALAAVKNKNSYEFKITLHDFGFTANGNFMFSKY